MSFIQQISRWLLPGAENRIHKCFSLVDWGRRVDILYILIETRCVSIKVSDITHYKSDLMSCNLKTEQVFVSIYFLGI
jgi:hypothetical protein